LIFFRDRDGDENWRAFSVDINTDAVVPLTPEQGVKILRPGNQSQIFPRSSVRHNQRDKRYFDLFRVNIVTGASELQFENPDFPVSSPMQLPAALGSRLNAAGTTEVFELYRRDRKSGFSNCSSLAPVTILTLNRSK